MKREFRNETLSLDKTRKEEKFKKLKKERSGVEHGALFELQILRYLCLERFTIRTVAAP